MGFPAETESYTTSFGLQRRRRGKTQWEREMTAKTVPALGVALSIITSSAMASADDPSNVLSINALEVINGSIGVEYERVLIPRLSLAVGVSFYDSDLNVFGSGGTTVIGPEFTLQPRFYILRDAPRGLYLSPFFSLDYLNASGIDDGLGDGGTLSANGFGYSVGGIVGWSWLFWDVLNIKAGIGAKYEQLSLSLQTGCGTTPVGTSGVAPAGELSAGWAF